MRILVAALALSLSTVAVAADPACVASVQTQAESLASEYHDSTGVRVVELFNESDAADDVCDLDETVLDDSGRFPAEQVVCDALFDEMEDQLNLMAALLRMAGECHESPTCSEEDKMDILESAKNVMDDVASLIKSLDLLGCL